MSVRGLGRLRTAAHSLRGRWIQRRLAGRKLLRAFSQTYEDPFFIEIGANDGEHHDHLRGFIRAGDWAGIMVEPVPYVFERLRANYVDRQRIALENVAIADRDGELPFFHLAEADARSRGQIPSWYTGLGSFDRDVVLAHSRVIPDIESRLVETRVPTLTLKSLCERHRVERVDLLTIDTEGYDYELLRSVDLARVHPRLVIYEHYHLTSGDRAACRKLLAAAGYELLEEGFDTWCLDTGPEDGLTKTWRRVRPALPGVYAEDEPAGSVTP